LNVTISFLFPDTPLQVSNGCATVQLGDISYSGSTPIPDSNWVATPSVYEVQPGRKQEYSKHLKAARREKVDLYYPLDSRVLFSITD